MVTINCRAFKMCFFTQKHKQHKFNQDVRFKCANQEFFFTFVSLMAVYVCMCDKTLTKTKYLQAKINLLNTNAITLWIKLRCWRPIVELVSEKKKRFVFKIVKYDADGITDPPSRAYCPRDETT